MTPTKHEVRIRRALPHEAEALNGVITRSKRYWGYDPSFVEAYRSFLGIVNLLVGTQCIAEV